MNAVILKEEEYSELINSIKEIKTKLCEKPKSVTDDFIAERAPQEQAERASLDD